MARIKTLPSHVVKQEEIDFSLPYPLFCPFSPHFSLFLWLISFSPLFLPIISIPVCHHWDHRNLCVRRVPQILEETQTALHPGLLHLLLHPGISHDHRGTTQTLKRSSVCAHWCHTVGPLEHSPRALRLFLWISRQISACKAKSQLSEKNPPRQLQRTNSSLK